MSMASGWLCYLALGQQVTSKTKTRIGFFPPSLRNEHDWRHPRFTIITPVLNAADTLAESIESVLSQDFSSYEHWILDGLSTDGSLDIIARYPHLLLRSEKDSGLYQAMNRGASLASGEWLIFLQADDWLPPGALAAWSRAATQNPTAAILTGSAEAVCTSPLPSAEARKIRWQRTSCRDKKISIETIALGEPMLNARAFKRVFFQETGGFLEHYRLASDRDFLLRIAQRNPPAAQLEELVYRYRWHEGSRTMNSGNALSNQLTEENLQIAASHLRESDGMAKSILTRWHTAESVRAAMCALEVLDFRHFLASAIRGTLRSPFWSFCFLREFFAALPGFLARGCKTRSQSSRKIAS